MVNVHAVAKAAATAGSVAERFIGLLSGGLGWVELSPVGLVCVGEGRGLKTLRGPRVSCTLLL